MHPEMSDKLRCTVCLEAFGEPGARWMLKSSAKGHLKSEAHVKANESLSERQEARMENQRAVLREAVERPLVDMAPDFEYSTSGLGENALASYGPSVDDGSTQFSLGSDETEDELQRARLIRNALLFSSQGILRSEIEAEVDEDDTVSEVERLLRDMGKNQNLIASTTRG